MSVFRVSRIGDLLRRARLAIVEAGASSAASGGDVDAEGRMFNALCVLLVAALAARFAFVAFSGYPFEARTLAWALCEAFGLAAVARATAHLGFREATLVVRIIAIFVLAVPYASEMCVAVFHVGRSRVLEDHALAAIDAEFAFDWLAYVRWVDDRPILWTTTLLAYRSIAVQVVAIPFMLALSRQATRLYTYVAAQVFGLISVAAVASRFPALGAYANAHVARADFAHAFLTADSMTKSILWLRGDLSGPFGVTNFGLISFPSYHSVCAALFTWATWKTRLRWPFVAVNTAMLLGTPVHGSHYLVDVVAGVIMAAIVIVVARVTLRLAGERHVAVGSDLVPATMATRLY